MNRDLPATWAWAPFDEVARVAANLVDPKDYPDLPHIAPNHIEPRTGRLLQYRTVAEDGVISSKHRFYPGQILYSKIRPYLAKATLVDFEGLCSADMYPLDTDLDARYLLYWLLSDAFTQHAVKEQGRSLLPKINKEQLGRLPVPVAPGAEQRRITALLDAEAPAFEAAARGLERIRRLIAQLRHQILASAVASAPGSKSIRTSVAEVSTQVRNGVFVSRPGTVPNGTPILRVGAVRALALNLDDPRWTGLSNDDERLKRYLLEEGDLLFTRYNGNADFVGACAVVPRLTSALVYPDKLIRVRLDPETAFGPFVAMLCSVGEARDFIRGCVRTTAGQAGIAGRDLRKVPLTLPSVAEQRRIWSEAETSLGSLEEAGQAVEKLAKRVDAARRGVIGLAVTGAMGTGSEQDEPAELLLLSTASKAKKQTRTTKKMPRRVRDHTAATTPEIQEPRS